MSCRAREPGARADGFSLLELLVALGILGLVSTMLLGGVVSAGLVMRQSSRERDALSEVAAAQLVLRARIALLAPVGVTTYSPPEQEARGTPTEFAFFALPPDGQRDGGLRKYRLRLSPQGDLSLYHASELANAIDLRGAPLAGWQRQALLPRVASLSLSYYGATRFDPQKRWRQYWQGNSRAPELVRVRVAFARGDARIWPDLYVRPVSDLDLACDPEGRLTACPSVKPSRS